MKKSKFMKALLVFGMSLVTATSVVGLVACGNDDTHNHIDEDNDLICDICGEEMPKEDLKDPTDPTDPVKPSNPSDPSDPTKPGDSVTKADVVINIKDVYEASSTLSDGSVLGEGVSIYVKDGKDAPSMGSSGGKKPLVAGEAVTDATHRLQLTSTSNCAIQLDLEEDATVLVYANSNGSDVRTLGLYSDLGESATVTQKIGVSGNELDTAVFSVKGGDTYYIGASNTINIFYIIVSYKGITETVQEHVNENDATCTEKGTIEYYQTNYGRYYTLSGETKTYLSIQEVKERGSDALGHDYSIKTGSLSEPTATETGSVTLVCSRDATHEVLVELPVLSSNLYTRTPADNNQTTYTYKSNGIDITFTTTTISETKYTFETLYSNIFATDGSVAFGTDLTNATTLISGIKACGTTNDSNVTAWDTTYNVSVSNGSFVVTDKGTKTPFGYIVFDSAKTSGVYKITGKINVAAVGSKWNVLQLIGSNGVTTSFDGSFAALRLDTNKKWSLSLDGAADSEKGSASAAATKATDYEFEFIIDLDNKLISLKVGSEQLGAEVNYQITTSDWLGIKIQIADSATDRSTTIKDLVISQRVVDTSAD